MKKSKDGSRIKRIIGLTACLIGCGLGVAWWALSGDKSENRLVIKTAAVPAAASSPAIHDAKKIAAARAVAQLAAPRPAQALPPTPASQVVTDTTGKQPISYVKNELLLRFRKNTADAEVQALFL